MGSGCGCTSSEIIKDMKAKEELGRGGARRERRRWSKKGRYNKYDSDDKRGAWVW